MPFRDAPVRREPTVQVAGGGSVLIQNIAAYNGPKLLDIEISVLQLDRIEGPLDEVDAARECVLALRNLEQASHAVVAILAQHAHHVAVQVRLFAAFEAGNRQQKARQLRGIK